MSSFLELFVPNQPMQFNTYTYKPLMNSFESVEIEKLTKNSH